MAHEASPPETYRTPEGGLFNVAAMSDAQIFEVNDALQRSFDHVLHNVGGARHDENNRLLDLFASDVRALGQSDPVRLQRLVNSWVHDEEGTAHRLAAEVTDGLIDYDYAFTRSTLVDLCTFRHPIEGQRVDNFANDAAQHSIARLMRDRLNPDQAAEFNAIIEARSWAPIEPADPGSDY